MLNKEITTKENLLADLMFKESAKNPAVKKALHDAGLALSIKVLDEIQKAVNEKGRVDDLPKHLKDSLNNLARHHSNDERQYGSVMASYDPTTGDILDYNYNSARELTSDLKTINLLLDTLRNAVLNIENTSDELSIAKAVKTIVDLGFCYREFYPSDLKSAEYENINNMIWPTESEFIVRLSRTQLGQADQLQTKFGIGHTPDDGMAPKSEGVGRGSGSAFWGKVDMATAIAELVKNYDTAKLHLFQVQKQLNDNENKSENEKKLLIAQVEKWEKTVTDLAKKMNYLRIPLNPDQRDELSVYQARWKTMLEKLTDGKMALIASVSGSTARPLISLLDFNTFTKPDGTFDLNQAQMLANCIMALFIRAGHHSYAEVGEILNRVLDYVAIYRPEQLPKGIIPENSDSAPIGTVEKSLPYFKYTYESFFHPSYTATIMQAAQTPTEAESVNMTADKKELEETKVIENMEKNPAEGYSVSTFFNNKPAVKPYIEEPSVQKILEQTNTKDEQAVKPIDQSITRKIIKGPSN